MCHCAHFFADFFCISSISSMCKIIKLCSRWKCIIYRWGNPNAFDEKEDILCEETQKEERNCQLFSSTSAWTLSQVSQTFSTVLQKLNFDGFCGKNASPGGSRESRHFYLVVPTNSHLLPVQYGHALGCNYGCIFSCNKLLLTRYLYSMDIR